MKYELKVRCGYSTYYFISFGDLQENLTEYQLLLRNNV